MATLNKETVISVNHWTDRLFSFTTTRQPSFRYRNGQFTMIGLAQPTGRPLLRAYSMVSANYEHQLEFLSIKVQDGPLTSQLQHIVPGDEVIVNSKATGTLITDNLLPGKRLYLFGTGTGLAPFMSIIKDPDIYDQYEKIILVHGCRQKSELAYNNDIENVLPQHEYIGENIRNQLLYYPTVTREPFTNTGRITTLIESEQLFHDLELPTLSSDDRFMLCGSPTMLRDVSAMLDELGFNETRGGQLGHYVIERAFVEQ